MSVRDVRLTKDGDVAILPVDVAGFVEIDVDVLIDLMEQLGWVVESR